MRRLLALLAVFAVAGCATSGPEAPATPAADEAAEARALVLVSLDGFRHDYLDRDVEMPTLRTIAGGVRAERLVPVFPTKTFPNHYSLVTGLYTPEHGVVGNTMRDPTRLVNNAPAEFSMSNRDAVTDGRWWGGEPIWVTAEKQGVTAATVFWPGSEAEIEGVRPTFWLPFDGGLDYDARVDQGLAWLDEGAELVTLYFEAVDSAGHRHGPDAPEVDAAIEDVDAALARLVDGLRQRGRLATTDLVVVSDHGMAAVSPERVVLLDDAVDLDAVDVDWGEPVGLWPDDAADVPGIVAAVSALPHLTAYAQADVPERLHYSGNARIPPVVVLADEGWTASSRAYVERNPDRPSGGTHGYDNRHRSMHGIFLASGPSVRTGVVLDELAAVDVYGVVAAALGLEPAPNEGSEEAVERVLR